ncbi:NAD(P)-binding domain-containing protein [Saccharopolyspora gregorii]|uniref:NAD(P)-binding domain-containing protein n=1 Tax=Saccharopolyspora gregorii TaxID=33914 RepID=UPI003CD0B316
MDSLPEPGGQVAAMYPEKLIFDVPGFPALRGRDLVAPWWSRPRRANRATCWAGRHRTVRSGWTAAGAGGPGTVRARAVLITAGIGEFTPRPLPAGGTGSAGELVHFVPDLAVHRGQDVVVVGGGDSAFDWALALHPIARSVTLVHPRRARFRAHPGPGAGGRRARRRDHHRGAGGGGARTPRACTRWSWPSASGGGCCPRGPWSPRSASPPRWGRSSPGEWSWPALDPGGQHDAHQPGPGVRGGRRGHLPGKVKLIATGFGEAATAVNNLAVALDPAAHLFPGHSSDRS